LPAATASKVQDASHSHGFAGQVDLDGDHTHGYHVGTGLSEGFVVHPDAGSRGVDENASAIWHHPAHSHNLSHVSVASALGDLTHRHDIAGPTGGAGTDATAATRVGAPYTFVADLRILLDGTDITTQVLLQAQSRMSTEDWTRFGDGTQGHALVRIGSGEIDLLQLAELGPGEHTLEFIPGQGGMLHYNLYVE
jgi:hypothetical protein